MQALEQFESILNSADKSYTKEEDNMITVEGIEVGGIPIIFTEGEYGWVDTCISFTVEDGKEVAPSIAQFLDFQTTVAHMFGNRIWVECEEGDYFIIGCFKPRNDRIELELDDFVDACIQILPVFMRIAEEGEWKPEWEPLILDDGVQGKA